MSAIKSDPRVYRFASREGLTLSEKIELEFNSNTPFAKREPLEILGERKFGFLTPNLSSKYKQGTQIQEAFTDASVLVTGATGFLGKAIVEKLLRSLPKLDRMYLIMRPKKNQNISERLDLLLESKLFRRVKIEMPNFKSKITVLEGDCSVPGLGLSASDRQMLVNNLNYIFHSAATTKFNEKMKTAVTINVVGTLELVKLAKETRGLKAFVHVSTAFCNCSEPHMEEKFYNPPAKYHDIIELVNTTSEEELEIRERSILGKLPNFYVFSKALAENVILEEGKGLPMAVVRPSIVYPTYREPVRGWTESLAGFSGIPVGVGLGFIQVLPVDPDLILDLIPVDVVANTTIAAAWKTATVKEDPIPVYNCVSQPQNPISVDGFIKPLLKYARMVPAEQGLWYMFLLTLRSHFLYRIISFFLHTIRGHLLDLVIPKKKNMPSISKIYEKLAAFLEQTYSFPFYHITFDNQRMQNLWNSLSAEDKDLFFFDMGTLNWDYMWQTLPLGIRYYLINEDMCTLDRGRKRAFQYYVAHTIIKYSLLFLAVYLCYRLLIIFMLPIQYLFS